MDAGSYRRYLCAMNVGTKELKNRLSHYLGRVRAGEVVRVTDRGEVIAELRAVTRPSTDEQAILGELEAEGVITVGTGRFTPHRRVRLRGGRSASRTVLEDRG